MESIILITNNNKMLDKIETRCKAFNINSIFVNNKLIIEMMDGRIYISLSKELEEDFDYAELEILKKIFFGEIFYYLICYSNKKVLKEIMHIFTFQEMLYIDDDEGHIIPLSIYKEYLISGNMQKSDER